MSSNGIQSIRVLQSQLRVTRRSIDRTLTEIKASIQSQEESALPGIQSDLNDVHRQLEKLQDTCSELVDHIESAGKTDAAIEKEADAIMSDYDRLYGLFREQKREFLKLEYMIRDKKTKEEQASLPPQRRSMGMSTSIVETNTVKLPRVELRKFMGNRKEFHDWEGLFENIVVKDDRFDALQKLYYLKTLLEGEASKLVANVPYEASAFEPAWKAVKDFYGNKRSVIAQHFSEILDLPTIKNEDDLRSALCTVSAAMRGLGVHGINAKAMSPMITFVVVRKFSVTIRREWEKAVPDTSNYPEFSALETFMKNIAFAFEGAKVGEREASPMPSKAPNPPKRSTVAAAAAQPALTNMRSITNSKSTAKCSLCGADHHLAFCNRFLTASVSERLDTVKRLSLCKNCLKPNHTAVDCRFSSCRKCNQRHNTTLHSENVQPESSHPETKSVNVVSGNQKATCLPSAIAYVLLGWRKIAVRILLDSCAEMSLISESLVRKYRIPTHRSHTVISGATPGDYTSRHAANIRLKAVNSDFSMDMQAVVHPMLSYHVDPSFFEKIKRDMPDFHFGESINIDHDSVDIIIGSDFLHQCTLNEKKVVGTLVLEASKFGWVASGVTNFENTCNQVSCHFIGDVTDSMRKYFEIEEVDATSIQTSEVEEIESHFLRSVRYTEKKKLSVSYPFKRSKSDVADTERMALAALIRNERQLSLENRSLYNKFMQDYLELHHMELIPEDQVSIKPRYYLPHHAVIRPSSLTTKLRAVFNGSAKNTSGCSLNDTLMIGPVIQPDLFTCLIKFRQYAIAVTADISKMYRCIEIHEEDRDMQRILWRFDSSEPVQHYRLKTITYGTSAAPYLATRCLQKVADDNFGKFPEAANSIRTEFYMDDWLSGGFSLEEAIQKQRVVHDLLAVSHLPLVKYASNSKTLLAAIDNKLHSSLTAVEFNTSEIISILGLKWLPEEDTLAVKSNFNFAETLAANLTKRTTLSLVSKIFDPLGILAPVTITGKILMQDIWREETNWDDPISLTMRAKVSSYLNSLSMLKLFQLKRCYADDYLNCQRQLVGFSDASEHAYSAVLYLRLIRHDNRVTSILVCSKTRVAPIKALTIPRLELCGAVLLTKLAIRVRKILEIAPENVYCFCDSTIVLTWIRSPADKYTVFIRNRSAFIQSTLSPNRWFHTRGDQNPADLCTRGITTKKCLQLLSFWSFGPSWLIDGFNEFLQGDVPLIDAVPERRQVTVAAVVANNLEHFTRFSSFDRLIRVTAWMLRYFDRIHKKLRPSSTALQLDEIDRSFRLIIRLTQEFYFSREYAALQQGEALPSRSILNSLNVFLHSDKLIRVGGRLGNALLAFEQKHPIVLPRKSEITFLLVRDLHLRHFHANLSLLLNFVRSKYWIVGGVKILIKSVIRRCVFCTRLAASVRNQIMADLPAARVQVSRPFAHTGVDYAGPISVKCTNHRSTKFNKAYLAFFICFSTKAVHIEIVSDLTTESFLFTFDRFISRRGMPSVMHSDNATNFVGFANVISKDQLQDFASKRNFTWKFIPARSPHVGGLWEAAVKAGKRILLKAVGQQVLTLEQLNTVIVRVEAILNSRPLCNDNSAVTNYLTPAHFLIGSTFFDLPAVETFSASFPKRYRSLRQIIESFWVTWRKDYLRQLQVRSKWQKPQSNVQVDDIVLLRDDKVPVLQWPLGRVTQTFPGRDGAVRSIELLCNDRHLTRSIHNVVTLPT